MRRQAAETDAAILGEVGAQPMSLTPGELDHQTARDSVARSWSGRERTRCDTVISLNRSMDLVCHFVSQLGAQSYTLFEATRLREPESGAASPWQRVRRAPWWR